MRTKSCGHGSRARKQNDNSDPHCEFLSDLWELLADNDMSPETGISPEKEFNRVKRIVINYLVRLSSTEDAKVKELEIKRPGEKTTTRIGKPPIGFVLTGDLERQLWDAGSTEEVVNLLRPVMTEAINKKRECSNAELQSTPSPRKKMRTETGKEIHTAPTHSTNAGVKTFAADKSKEKLRNGAGKGRNNTPRKSGKRPLQRPKIKLKVRSSRQNVTIKTQQPSPSPDDVVCKKEPKSQGAHEQAGSLDQLAPPSADRIVQQNPAQQVLDNQHAPLEQLALRPAEQHLEGREQGQIPIMPAPLDPRSMAAIVEEDAGYQSNDTDDSQLSEPTSTGAYTKTSEKDSRAANDFEAIQHILTLAGSFNDESAKISLVNWQNYSLKLTEFCSTAGVREMGFEQRMHQIKRIIYLDEERDIIASGDWDRLPSVARLCAYLGKLTGKDACDQKTTYWLSKQLKDIHWLQRILETRD